MRGLAGQYLFHPAYAMWRRVHPAWKESTRLEATVAAERRRLDRLAAPERTTWIRDALASQMHRAASTSPFWQERLHGAGWTDRADPFAVLAALPVFEKQDIREHSDTIRGRQAKGPAFRVTRTGGSTGAPVEVITGPLERAWSSSGLLRMEARLGVPPGASRAFLWGHNLDPLHADSLRERMLDLVHNREWYDCFRLDDDVLRGYHERLERQRPTVLIAYASALGELARWLERNGIHPRYPRTAIITGAEKLQSADREVAERVFSVPVRERYGGRDVGLMAFQPRERNDEYEVDWQKVVLEPEGGGPEGDILVTKLHADGFPMFRYRVGDVGRFAPSERGSAPYFRLLEVVGRSLEHVRLPTGRLVHGTQFPHFLKDFPIVEYQVVQQADYSVELLVLPAAQWSAAAEAEITRVLSANMPGIPLAVRTVSSIERTAAGKRRPVISHVAVPGPSAPAAVAP